MPFSSAIISDPTRYWFCGKGRRDVRGDGGNTDQRREDVWRVSGGLEGTGIRRQRSPVEWLAHLKAQRINTDTAGWGVAQNPPGERTPPAEEVWNQPRFPVSACDLLYSLESKAGLFLGINLLHTCSHDGASAKTRYQKEPLAQHNLKTTIPLATRDKDATWPAQKGCECLYHLQITFLVQELIWPLIAFLLLFLLHITCSCKGTFKSEW